MNPDSRRELIPRATTFHLIDALNAVRGKLSGAFEQWELLDDTGRVPASPSYTALLQHAADAQALARDVVQLTADFARTTSSTNRAGSAVLAHLASAVTLSSQAVPHFAETAQTALSPPRPHSENDSYLRDNRMVVEHATARACLRRAAQALGDAVQELTEYLDFHPFFLTPSHRQSPVPPPKPGGRHR
ncbi:hypothetical protein JHN52_30130 [Streptomyces sp. MBT97]|uniref:hypothetical protein n=1 Tax=Streptomyces sp. MBT97 TaxID=2800411 RepID=UPI00190CB1EB|nr:hypothetical protein [Streptomyces sp. MBT97]MBK3637090.1 hypothetical protein [Streptomyces sp. MBT97]